MESFDLITLVGGMSLFLYGMFMSRDGIQHFAGDRFKTIITGLTSNRFKGLMVGGIFTVLLQSSTALTVMLVGIAHSGMISLGQVMPILLGADIGTTLTVQLIAFKIDRFALLIVTAGFLIQFFGKKQRTRFLGTLVFGFGLIFFGMKLMVDSVAPLRDVQVFSNLMAYLGKSPMAALLLAVVFTAIVHSSAATIGLVLSLALGGSMSLEAAVPMVFGANIGTCGTALLAGMGSGAEGKRVAVSHIFWKVMGVLLFYPLMGPFIWLVRQTTDDVARQIANAHTIFNVGMAFIFLPFTGVATKVVSRFFREEEERERPFGAVYLDESGLHTPALALGYVSRELVRMARIVQDMATCVQTVFDKKDPDLAERLLVEDDKVDILNREIKFYLARLNRSTFTQEQSQRELELVSDTTDLEIMGDIITQSVIPAAKRYIQSGLKFSPEGLGEIRDFHGRVMKCFDTALASFETGDEILARQVLREKEALAALETHLKETHLERLHKGYQESFKTSSIHLEYLSNLRRISTLASRFSKGVLGRGGNDDRLDKVML